MDWTPTIDTADGASLSGHLLAAIERDAAAGVLMPGHRLPPQRELAYRLGIGVGTVSRAYAEAERRGIVVAHVGRGSFIADRSVMAGGGKEIDLSLNLPPLARGSAELAATLRELGRRGLDPAEVGYGAPAGSDGLRRAGERWLRESCGVAGADWRRIACTAGAQHGMDLAFAALARPGEPILCEELTYWGAKVLARHRGNPLHGVAMDGEGLLPDAIERAVRETGARVLYCTPTLQNPTTAVMGNARRREIAALARSLDLWLIEDDVYAHYAAPLGLPPLAELAPERTVYLASLSKSVLPGLRAGFLFAPDGRIFEDAALGLRASICAPSGLLGAIAEEWIVQGRATAIAEALREEVAIRTRRALDALGAAVTPPDASASLHLWLPMDGAAAARVTRSAAALGVKLFEPDTPRASPEAPHGLRFGIGAPATMDELDRALGLVAAALENRPAEPAGMIV